jgi:predicted metal-dependent phosphoesterase TrpH
MIADLHIHSIYSDGEDTPKQIAEKARKQGLPLISLTDHDTADGVNEMKREAAALGIECFPGIELSAFSCAEIHILGYNVEIFDKNFLRRLDFIKEQRQSRVASIIASLFPDIEISQGG